MPTFSACEWRSAAEDALGANGSWTWTKSSSARSSSSSSVRETSSGSETEPPRRNGSDCPTASTEALPGSAKSASGFDASAWTFARPSRTSSRESDGATTTTRWPRAQSSSESRSTKRLTSWCCSHGHGVTCAIENGSRGTGGSIRRTRRRSEGPEQLFRKIYTLCTHETRDHRSRYLRAHLRPPAGSASRGHRVRSRGSAGRAHAHRPRPARGRSGSRGHRLHRLQRPQLPRLRAPARTAPRVDPAVGHELLGQRRRR